MPVAISRPFPIVHRSFTGLAISGAAGVHMWTHS